MPAVAGMTSPYFASDIPDDGTGIAAGDARVADRGKFTLDSILKIYSWQHCENVVGENPQLELRPEADQRPGFFMPRRAIAAFGDTTRPCRFPAGA